VNLAVASEDVIKHLFEVDPIAMCLNELRSNNWRQISQHAAAKRIQSPKRAVAFSLAEIEIDRGAARSPIA
jgi:hypothetical protein